MVPGGSSFDDGCPSDARRRRMKVSRCCRTRFLRRVMGRWKG
ncbi:unnamed protein product [Linum tenue]|uniref:Uncharacterized protein n=1 Tax=Linum tenue TaxID=586396 RepID=A0AAV0HY85_9ROSI|nr:unnamed protein product [Linum tenue]